MESRTASINSNVVGEYIKYAEIKLVLVDSDKVDRFCHRLPNHTVEYLKKYKFIPTGKELVYKLNFESIKFR